MAGGAGLTLHAPRARRVGWAGWSGLCGLAAAGALLAQGADPALLNWQPHLLLDQPWRAISAAWVHWSRLHLLANLLGTLLVAALGWAAHCGARAALAWALAWPLTHLALLLQPALTSYGGLSGVLHAGVAVAAVQVLRSANGPRRWVGFGLLAGLLVKTLIEAPWAGALRHAPGWDIAIAPLAHASGSLAGLVCALLLVSPARPSPGGAAS